MRFSQVPGRSLRRVYNSAGELTKVLEDFHANFLVQVTRQGDGTNHDGEKAASGVCVLPLSTSFRAEVRKVLLLC